MQRGTKHTEETKRLIREDALARTPSPDFTFEGRKHSEASRRKMGAKSMGNTHNRGRRHVNRKGKPLSEEHKQKIREGQRQHHAAKKAIAERMGVDYGYKDKALMTRQEVGRLAAEKQHRHKYLKGVKIDHEVGDYTAGGALVVAVEYGDDGEGNVIMLSCTQRGV